MTNKNELMDVISEKFEDLVIPGFLVEVRPIVVEIMGVEDNDAITWTAVMCLNQNECLAI